MNILNIDLIKELGLDSLPEETQKKIIDQMTEVVEKRLNTKILSLLSDEEKEELDRIIEQGEDASGFLRQRITDLDLITQEVVANFKQEMLDLYKAVKDKSK